MTPRILPESDAELLLMWKLCGSNHKATAAQYGCNESQVRKRIRKILGPSKRPYRRIPISREQLYKEWLELGASYGDGRTLADRYNVRPGTVRRALARFRQENTEEEIRREQAEEVRDGGRRPDLQWKDGRSRTWVAEHRVPQHAHGRPVR